jgi:hypothetical protein
MAISALPDKIKRNTHVQEGLRVLRNCRRDLPWPVKAEHLSTYMKRLQMSGYNHRYREQIITASINSFRKMEEAEDKGERPINRPDSFKMEERAQKKLLTKSTWYRRGGKKTVLFVPGTPGSKLAKAIMATLAKQNQGKDWGVRVVERSGKTIASDLQTLYPVEPRACGLSDCLPCLSGNIGVCRLNSVLYRINCETCDKEINTTEAPETSQPPGSSGKASNTNTKQYLGETSRNMAARSREHLRLYRAGSKDSPLWSHCQECHGGDKNIPEFSMTLISRHGDALARLLMEGLVIRDEDPLSLMNSRSENTKSRVARAKGRLTMAVGLGTTTAPQARGPQGREGAVRPPTLPSIQEVTTTTTKRKGRPPGALNKATIRASQTREPSQPAATQETTTEAASSQEREANIQPATRMDPNQPTAREQHNNQLATRDLTSNQPETTTEAPRKRGRPKGSKAAITTIKEASSQPGMIPSQPAAREPTSSQPAAREPQSSQPATAPEPRKRGRPKGSQKPPASQRENSDGSTSQPDNQGSQDTQSTSQSHPQARRSGLRSRK